MSPGTQRGFSYVEVLLSVVLLAVLLVPALEALQTGVMGNQAPTLGARQLALRDKMERIVATPFYDLYRLTYESGNSAAPRDAYSDASGTPERRMVLVYRYDPSAGALSDGDTGLLAVSVYYENEGPAAALSTLVGRWW